MPAADLIKRTSTIVLQPRLRPLIAGLAVMLALHSPFALSQTCPTLASYYPPSNSAPVAEWASKLPQLEALLESCLTNAEYFALLGAAQLNTGQVPQALESLERALLIDPNNGAAQIDYAEGLYLSGQLFPALEINTALLDRQDLPSSLRSMIEARQQSWQQQTFSRQFVLEATAGYDSNLNGGPARSDLSLTFGGTPLEFTLDPDYQPKAGSFANVRLGGVWQRMTPNRQHDLLATARLRKSSESNTDIAQADWRYSYAIPTLRNRWELSAGTSHMLFGGSPLYSAGEFKARFLLGNDQCRPGLEGGLQQLDYHGQSIMNGREASVVASYNCSFAESGQQLRLEVGFLANTAIDDLRPGGDRDGWNVRLNWQRQLGRNEFSSQLGYSRLQDETGYSLLLKNGATRSLTSQYINFRYKYAFAGNWAGMVNLSHQYQSSNLEPFRNRGTVAEVGLTLDF